MKEVGRLIFGVLLLLSVISAIYIVSLMMGA